MRQLIFGFYLWLSQLLHDDIGDAFWASLNERDYVVEIKSTFTVYELVQKSH